MSVSNGGETLSATQLLQNHLEQLSELYHQYASDVYELVRSRVDDIEDAEDVFMDCWLTVAESVAREGKPTAAREKKWIRTIVESHIARYYRYSSRKAPTPRAVSKRPRGASAKLRKEQARAIVEAGIGSRPDLPPGTEYVRRLRKVWRGLKPRG